MKLFFDIIKPLLHYRLLQHLLFWALVVLCFVVGYGKPADYIATSLHALIILPGPIVLVYILFYFLIPFYLLEKRWILFGLFFTLVFTISLLYVHVVSAYISESMHLKADWSVLQIIGQSTLLLAVLATKVLKQWYYQKLKILEMQRQYRTADLKLLRSQVHPHFLFNTLNSLYAHSLYQSADVPEIILKLSGFLRFMVYESNTDFVPLKKEIALIQQYIELEQLRYGDRLEVTINISGNLNGKVITPLLLLPLLENAYKHSATNKLDQGWIQLSIHVTPDNDMHFQLINSKEQDAAGKAAGGVGLQSVRKQLELIYPGQHQLTVTEDNEVYIISLDITLPSVPEDENVYTSELKPTLYVQN
jgi:sensor histidine kinase YesM